MTEEDRKKRLSLVTKLILKEFREYENQNCPIIIKQNIEEKEREPS